MKDFVGMALIFLLVVSSCAVLDESNRRQCASAIKVEEKMKGYTNPIKVDLRRSCVRSGVLEEGR